VIPHNRAGLVIFTPLENSASVYFQIVPAAIRAHLRDFGIHPFHAVFVEMDR
jgi:hypothetical protein